MRPKRNILVLIIAALAILVPNLSKAQYTDGGTIGVKLGYITYNESAVTGLFYQYRAATWLRIAPEINMVVRNQHVDGFNADINLHFPLSIANGDFSLYPLLGLDLAAWDVHAYTDLFGDTPSQTFSRTGLNLGAGFEYFTKKSIKFCIECRHTLNSDFSNTTIGLGIGYMF